jgi:hypothetical protein
VLPVVSESLSNLSTLFPHPTSPFSGGGADLARNNHREKLGSLPCQGEGWGGMHLLFTRPFDIF